MHRTERPKRIVILGGGFGGVYTARYLEKLVRGRTDVEVILVNKENYFVFQPLLAEVVSGNIGILDAVNPLRRLLPRTGIFIREVDQIDLRNRQVILSPGFRPRARVLDYDHLVLAMGNVTDFRTIPGLREHALPFKTLADAIFLRNHLIHVLEEGSVETAPEMRRQLLTFVVAGGGFSGVEVAAEMNDFLRRVARQYGDLHADDIRVVLVHSGERVLHREFSERLSRYATQILRRRGVELRLKHRLRTASPDAAVLDDGERIPTKTIVSTVPSLPNPVIAALELPNRKGKLQVDASLRVPDTPGVWAIGDCALVPMPDAGFCPPTAQHATRQAKTLAHNLVASLDGTGLKRFEFQGLGKMGSLGYHSAVAELFDRIKLSGPPAWLMWRSVYWWKLPGVVRKVKVGLAWLLDLMFPPDFVQLKTAPSNGITQAHFEPGEVVFHQGDLGDALYIMLRGEAEVVVADGGEPQVVARLGPGDYFGEMALINRRTRSATVRCAEPMEVLALRKSEFATLTANLPELRKSFEQLAAQRQAAAEARARAKSGSPEQR